MFRAKLSSVVAVVVVPLLHCDALLLMALVVNQVVPLQVIAMHEVMPKTLRLLASALLVLWVQEVIALSSVMVARWCVVPPGR